MQKSVFQPFIIQNFSKIFYNAYPKDLYIALEFKNIIDKAESIARQRHPDYPEGIFFDNVKAHIYRLIQTPRYINFPKSLKESREILERILLVHDLPEVLLSLDTGFDTSAVIKLDNPGLDNKILHDEDEVAKEMFSKEDYVLYENFEEAANVLEGRKNAFETEFQEALVAKIIDMGDGEVGFYFYLVEWIISEDFDGRLPTDRPYEFTMNRYEKYINNLTKLDGHINEDILSLCKSLVYDQITFILLLWEKVAIKDNLLIPEIAKKQISFLESQRNRVGSYRNEDLWK